MEPRIIADVAHSLLSAETASDQITACALTDYDNEQISLVDNTVLTGRPRRNHQIASADPCEQTVKLASIQLTTDDLHAPRAETAVVHVDVHVDPDQTCCL